MSATLEDEDLFLDDQELGEGASGVLTHLEDGHTYVASIGSLKPMGPSKYNPDKQTVQVEFWIEGEKYPIKKWFDRSFGSTKAHGYAFMSKLVQAVTGIRCGDHKQTKVKIGQIVGQQVNVRIGINDKGYPEVKEVSPFVG